MNVFCNEEAKDELGIFCGDTLQILEKGDKKGVYRVAGVVVELLTLEQARKKLGVSAVAMKRMSGSMGVVYNVRTSTRLLLAVHVNNLCTPAEAAATAGVSLTHIRRLIEAGTLRAVTGGQKTVRVFINDVEKYARASPRERCSVKVASERLGVSVTHTHWLIKQGHIEAETIGERKVFVYVDSIQKYINKKIAK